MAQESKQSHRVENIIFVKFILSFRIFNSGKLPFRPINKNVKIFREERKYKYFEEKYIEMGTKRISTH